MKAVDEAVVAAEAAAAESEAASERKREAVKAAIRGGVPLEQLEERGVYTIQHLRRIAREVGIGPRPPGRKRKTPQTGE